MGPADDRRYRRISVFGGGCYGSYYVRQLLRAREAGKAEWAALEVVDRNPACEAARRFRGALTLIGRDWADWCDERFGAAAAVPEQYAGDAIVPSPLMPHLLFEWLVRRARARWPARRVAPVMPATVEDVPWQKEGGDGTRYASFATWTCPVNCIEPHICPHTRGERTWSFPPALEAHVEAARRAGRSLDGPAVLHCTHRTHGVGMIDVASVLAADRLVESAAARRPAHVLVGTVSHCHAALGELDID